VSSETYYIKADKLDATKINLHKRLELQTFLNKCGDITVLSKTLRQCYYLVGNEIEYDKLQGRTIES
jgi:hypothetical protein